MKRLIAVALTFSSFIFFNYCYAQDTKATNDTSKVKTHKGKTKAKDKTTNVVTKEQGDKMKMKDRDSHDKIIEKNGKVRMKGDMDSTFWHQKRMARDSMRMHRNMRDSSWRRKGMHDSTGRMNRRMGRDSTRKYDKDIMNDSIR
jgi:hypothetical protein